MQWQDWQPLQKVMPPAAAPRPKLLGLEDMLEFVQDHIEGAFVDDTPAEEIPQIIDWFRDYLAGVTDTQREAPFLMAIRHALARAAPSGQPLLSDTICKAFLRATMPRLMDLCAPAGKPYSAVIVIFHDNGLFANVLQLLDALVLAAPGVPVLVDWQRRGPEQHFQYGPAGFDLFKHLFQQTPRCHSLAEDYSINPHGQVYTLSKRVNVIFMNLLRGLIWGIPEPEQSALRQSYRRAMDNALELSPLMRRRVDEVCATWPRGARVVGVHKRLGANEVAACQLNQRTPPPTEFIEQARHVLADTPPGVPQVLFLATDEISTVQAFTKAFPKGGTIQLCCREGVKRSKGGVRADGVDDEVHRSLCEPKDAEDALVDAICLSRCEDLLCIDSNLSISVSLLNPQIRLHALSSLLPPGWEEISAHPREPVYSGYRVVRDPGMFVAELPSTASELIGCIEYGQHIQTTGRLWDGWVELAEGGWVRIHGSKSGCWAAQYFPGTDQLTMLRVTSGELLVPDGELIYSRPRWEEGEPLPPALARAETLDYSFSTFAYKHLAVHPQVRASRRARIRH